PTTETFEMDERRRTLTERDGTWGPHGQQRTEAPEPARGRAERVGGDAGERREIVLDAEIHGDALGATARAARKETRLLEAHAATQTRQSDDTRLGAHGGR